MIARGPVSRPSLYQRTAGLQFYKPSKQSAQSTVNGFPETAFQENSRAGIAKTELRGCLGNYILDTPVVRVSELAMRFGFAHFWPFLNAVWDHAVTLAAGCVVTVVINLFEKYALRGKKLPLKVDVAILLSFLFFACFQAWRDQYLKVIDKPPTTVVQVNTPPINVPPPEVVIMPAPTSPSTPLVPASVELKGIKVLTKVMTAGEPISLSVYFAAKGDNPVHGLYAAEFPALVDYKQAPDLQNEKESERLLMKTISETIVKRKADLEKEGIPGTTLGSDNGVMYQTVNTAQLTDKQVEGLLNWTTRLYVVTWTSWKIDKNKTGEKTTCNWMQPPTSTDLSKDELVWHICEWVP